jgi:FkbM family methyltransferase
LTDTVVSPRGRVAVFANRPESSDLSLVASTFDLWGGGNPDEYRLAELHVSGVFVDIGAHIGTVAIAVLLDNPGATAIAIEPLADNCRMIEQNAALNGVSDRLTIHHAAIGKGKTAEVAHGYQGEFASERYIGNLGIGTLSAHSVETVSTITLRSLGPIEALKIDCEGCEWKALSEPCVKDIRVIIGEAHSFNDWPERVDKLLDATHEIEIIANHGGTGVFRAVRR